MKGICCENTPILGSLGARGDICPRAQHFGGAKLRSECYVLITKCQMSTDSNNYNLQNVECHCESHQDHQGSQSETL